MECPEIRRILYATDTSKYAHHAFGYAACMARAHNASIILLHVVDEIREMVTFDYGIERSVAASKWFSVGNEYYLELKEQFKRFAEEKYQSQDVNIEVVLVERGNPVKTILLIAEKNDCDMIIMGGRGHDSQEDLALGNTVAGVLRRAKIPVLVTRFQQRS
jgi:nucleotide-binding universal stress UspA family protein